ncbi:hypothetical protein A3K78_05300 [Candidatus Bathyarchaeota archaeon RBG_13_52_12]|nr:MAG: hypothetical protein A3K78_05300 [Candidatus Bathyarchaeota archaeon RBG_13_52_12]
MKILTLLIIAAALTAGGSGAILYYAMASSQTHTVKAQVMGVGGRIIAIPDKGTGYIQNDTLTFQVESGVNINLQIIPDPGWRFSSWGGDLQGNVNPISVIVNKDMYITANLVPK